MADLGRELIHGSSVAFSTCRGWEGMLIIGRSGSGKSELALELLSLGARLIADDQTELFRRGTGIAMRAPGRLRGMIELRGMGVLRAAQVDEVDLVLVVDMDEEETERLPHPHHFARLGITVPRLRRCTSRVFAAGLKHYIMERHRSQEHVLGTRQS